MIVCGDEDRVGGAQDGRDAAASGVAQGRLVQHGGGASALAVAHARIHDADRQAGTAHRRPGRTSAINTRHSVTALLTGPLPVTATAGQ
jgi:hypothetical protein